MSFVYLKIDIKISTNSQMMPPCKVSVCILLGCSPANPYAYECWKVFSFSRIQKNLAHTPKYRRISLKALKLSQEIFASIKTPKLNRWPFLLHH